MIASLSDSIQSLKLNESDMPTTALPGPAPFRESVHDPLKAQLAHLSSSNSPKFFSLDTSIPNLELTDPSVSTEPMTDPLVTPPPNITAQDIPHRSRSTNHLVTSNSETEFEGSSIRTEPLFSPAESPLSSLQGTTLNDSKTSSPSCGIASPSGNSSLSNANISGSIANLVSLPHQPPNPSRDIDSLPFPHLVRANSVISPSIKKGAFPFSANTNHNKPYPQITRSQSVTYLYRKCCLTETPCDSPRSPKSQFSTILPKNQPVPAVQLRKALKTKQPKSSYDSR